MRNLAGRYATAARETKGLTEDSVKCVGNDSVLASESGRTLDEIVRYVKKVLNLVAEIDLAGCEQSTGIERVNKAVIEMDQMPQRKQRRSQRFQQPHIRCLNKPGPSTP